VRFLPEERVAVKAKEEAYDRERGSTINVAVVPAPHLSRRPIANCRPVEKGPSVFVPVRGGKSAGLFGPLRRRLRQGLLSVAEHDDWA
jgi:hypothetical protein